MTGQRKASDVPLPGGDFRLLVTRLAFQAMISLGILENPVTKTRQLNLDTARMLLADLAMLLEKTRGNLEADEQAHLEKVITDLRAAMAKMPA